MTILYGTDFSVMADSGARVAATLAERRQEPLVLLHVLPERVPGLEKEDRRAADEAQAKLETLAAGLGGARVSTRLERGAPDVVVPKVAREIDASLAVVAAASARASRWLLGSTADRIASTSERPILVLRDGFPVDEWLSGKRPLHVAIAADLSPISDHAIEWAASLAKIAPCRFTLAHVSWPEEAYHRLGIEGPLPLDRTHPAVERLIARDLESAKETICAAGPCEVVIEPPAKKPADALARVAVERKADLLVVGHQPSRRWRVWEGSVARAVIRSSPVAVACVPHVHEALAPRRREVSTILAATDLSEPGNAAVAYAAALVPPDGTIIILHVIEEGEMTPKERHEIVEGLKLMAVDQRLTECRVDVRFEIVESGEPARAIAEMAEREKAHLVCIASRGRSHLPRILIGSVAQELLLSSRVPVLLVPS